MSDRNAFPTEEIPDDGEDLEELLDKMNCQYGSYAWNLAIKAYVLGREHEEEE